MGGLGYKPECKTKEGFDSLDDQQMEKILFQMKNCICKIKIKEKLFGTGFFCKIPFPDRFNFLPVLITCHHVIDENSLTQGSEIKFTLDNDNIKKSIVIDNSRRIYTNKDKDITIIQINPEEDEINYDAFLNVDDNIYKDNLFDIYTKKSVYAIHYEEGKKKKKSPGIIKIISVDKFNFKHTCTTRDGSSGAPIINLENFGVMGIHKGSSKPEALNKINYGTVMKIPIDEFNELYKNSESKPLIQSIPKETSSYQTTIETNELHKNSESKSIIQSIPKEISSYQTKIETGNFYVSNIN